MSVQNTHTRAGRHLLKTPIIQRISHSSQNMSFNYPSKVCNSHTVHGAKGVDLCVCGGSSRTQTGRRTSARIGRPRISPGAHVVRAADRFLVAKPAPYYMACALGCVQNVWLYLGVASAQPSLVRVCRAVRAPMIKMNIAAMRYNAKRTHAPHEPP